MADVVAAEGSAVPGLLRILLAEDVATDAELVERVLRDGGLVFTSRRVWQREAFLAELENFQPDIILADYRMPQFDGMEALCLAQSRAPLTPVVILTGSLSEETAAECIKSGASDYILKDRLLRLAPAVRAALEKAALLAQRRRAEAENARLAQEWQTTFDAMRDAVALLDPEGKILRCNLAMASLAGRPSGELVGQSCCQVFRDDASPHPDCPVARLRRTLRHETRTAVFGPTTVEITADPVLDAAGQLTGIVHVVSDITGWVEAQREKERLQAQLLYAQRLEAVGRLAGGVAHDFNNMLTAILGYGEAALDGAPSGSQQRDDIQQVLKAANRSQEVTRQLLAFARRQPATPLVLELNEAVENMLKMLRRLIGEDLDLAWWPGAAACTIRMDPSQLDQILANLVVNARDAIEGVGRITIRTRHAVVDEAACRDKPEFAPGDYVCLAVHDTGVGMDESVLAKIFEPFFTTKGVGRGTGLGLATVYGIVKQNGGFVDVRSRPGDGSSFELYLPRVAETAVATPQASASAPPEGRGETVLVVEDEGAVLELTLRLLRGLGYSPLAARTPDEALQLAGTHPGEIHLLLTDVVMPGMNGTELAERLGALRPGLKRLFMSGYTSDVVEGRGLRAGEVRLLQKPFSRVRLAASVKAALRGE